VPARTKTLFAILFGIPLLMAASCAAGFIMIQRAGTIEVSIHEKSGGTHIGMSMPAIVVPVVLHLAKNACPVPGAFGFHDHADVPIDFVREVLDVLADSPDGVLVDVRTEDEVVLVEKRGARLLVDIDTREDKIHAAVPLSTARSILGVI
jgi:hypothetical protein